MTTRRQVPPERGRTVLTFEADEDEPRADLLGSLYEWLRRSDQLVRSPVELVPRPGSPGEMGGVADLVLNLNVLEIAAALSVIVSWLRFRGVDIDAERTADGDVKVRIRRARHRRSQELGTQLTDLLRHESEIGQRRNIDSSDRSAAEDDHEADHEDGDGDDAGAGRRP